MQMKILVVLVLAVALPWASAESEERGFLSKYNPFNGVVGRDISDEEVRGLRNFFAKLNPFNGVVGREELERGFGTKLKNFLVKTVPAVLQEGSKFLINRANAKGREEVDERSFKSFLRGAKNLALGAVGSILGRELTDEEERGLRALIRRALPHIIKGAKVAAPYVMSGAATIINAVANGREEEERSFKTFINKVGKVVKTVAPAILIEGSKFLINRANAKGREEEEERSFKSFIHKVGNVAKTVGKAALKVAPLAIGAATLIGRENEEERSFKSFIHKVGNVAKKVGKVALKVAPAALLAGSLIGREE